MKGTRSVVSVQQYCIDIVLHHHREWGFPLIIMFLVCHFKQSLITERTSHLTKPSTPSRSRGQPRPPLAELSSGESSRDTFYELLKDWEKKDDKRQGLNQREKIK